MVVETALGDLDVLIRFADYNYHVAVSAVVIADQVAGADLIPAWVVHPPPREVSKRRVRTQRSPAGAVGAPAVGPAAGGAVGRGVHCPGGVGLLQLRQDGLYAFFCGARGYGGRFLTVVLGAVNVDGVGGGVIGHAEVHRFADVPEADIVIAADAVGGEGCLLTIDIEGLATGPGGEIVCCLGGGAAQGKAGEDADSHKDRFPFPVHDLIPFRFCCAFRKHNHAEGVAGSQVQSGEPHGEKLRRERSTLHSRGAPIVFCGADFCGIIALDFFKSK